MMEQETSDWEREINHAQMMWRLSYKHECERRHAKMRFNEAAANEALEAQAEQDRIDARQLAAAEANKEKRQSTTIDGSWFIARAMKFITVVTVAAVAYRLFVIYFLGDL